MASKTAPNLFELSGDGIAVTYSTTSIDGQARFSFRKGRQTLNFSGNQIASVGTSIGTRKQAFRTIGITTVAKTTIAGPPVGVQQTYKTVALRGSARQVEF